MSADKSLSCSIFDSTLLLFGAGGHGRVVADAAVMMQSWTAIFASDNDPARCADALLPGVPSLDVMSALALDAGVHVAIGNNAIRAKVAKRWSLERLVSVIHPAAMVSPFAHVGVGCFVAAGAVVAPRAHVGVGSIVNHGAIVDHDVCIGDFCHIAPRAVLGGGVVLGKGVMVGSGAVILPSLTVADYVVIGAGAVVRAALLEPGTYVGVPARKVK